MYSSAYVWAKVVSHMEDRLGALFLGEFAGRGLSDIIMTVIGSALVVAAGILIAISDKKE